MDRSVGTANDSINESQDMLDVTSCTEASPGPALVSNSSMDSPFTSESVEPSTEQRPSQADTIVPASVDIQPTAVVDLASIEPAVTQQVVSIEDTLASGDHHSGPTIRDAETLADDLTRELLNNTVLDKENTPPEIEQAEQLDFKKTDNQTADESLIKLNDITNNELLCQTFKTAANTSQNSQHSSTDVEDKMEFSKNYSDDLLMGANSDQRAESGGPDLADFELPPYNGSSSSGSEQATNTKQSPVKQRKSSNTAATQAPSSSASGSLVPNDLTAVKNILVSTYSKGAHIFHWRKPIESGIIFAIGLTLIAALTFFSIISVVAYSAIGVVLASSLIRVYKTSMKALNRSADTPVDHIWAKLLNMNVSLSPERMHELVDSSHGNVNASFIYFKQVLLVEDKMATSKFFLFLYSLTYIGAWFNGLTLITIIYVSMFSVPIIYDQNKTKIDEYLNLATKQVSSAISMVMGKVTSLAFGAQSASVGSSKKQN